MATVSLLNNDDISSHFDTNNDSKDSVKIVFDNVHRDSIKSELNWSQQHLNSQLITAIVSKNFEAVQKCLNDGADSNSICRTHKFTVLHLAVVFYMTEILVELLKFGADPKIADRDGLTPLHYGAWYNHDECMDILIKHFNGEDRTKFINRQVQEDTFVVTDLQTDSLNHRCDQLLDKFPKKINMGSTAVHIACQMLHEKCVRILVEQKCNINLKDCRGLTPFDVIGELINLRVDKEEDMAKEFVDIINLIKFVGGQKGASDSNCLYFTPIHAAVMLTSNSAITLLVHDNIDPNRFDTLHETPIHLSIIKRKQLSLKALLECVKDVTMIRNGNGLTPFQTAVKEQWIEGIGILMKEDANITEKTADGRTVLHIAAATGNVDLLEELLKLKKIKKILNTKNGRGETPIFTAISIGELQCVKILLKNGVDISIKLDQNISVMHKAAESGHADILDALLEHAKDQNLYLMDEPDMYSLTPLHIAARTKLGCVKVLLERKCNYEVKTKSIIHPGWLAIHIAANLNNAEIVEEFLKRDKKLLNIVDTKSKTPIYYAAFHGHQNTIEVLIKAGANVLTTYEKRTILDMIYKNISNPTEFLCSIFDSFVSLDTKSSITNKDCKIKMNFDVLLAKEDGNNQMSILYNIFHNCKDSEEKELIIHPLIECFIFLKWQKLRHFFVMFLFFYIIFVGILTGFIFSVFYNNKPEKHFDINQILYLLLGLAISFIIVCLMDILLIETIFKAIYKERCIKWISLTCALVLIMFSCTNYQYLWLRNIASLALITSWIELMFMLSKVFNCGYYVQMFYTVVFKVVKVMLLFIVFIFGFALAFMIELNNIKAFLNPMSAMMKTFAIMMAELDYNDLFIGEQVDNVHPVKLAIYFVFILLATISLMNLMVGLAVNDIQELETKGVVDRLAAQINFLYICKSNRFEKILPKTLKTKFDSLKPIDNELSLVLFDPKNSLTKKLNSKLKERVIKLVTNNKNIQGSNNDILKKIDTLMQMIAELKNTRNNPEINLN